jgi:hypothetical protein
MSLQKAVINGRAGETSRSLSLVLVNKYICHMNYRSIKSAIALSEPHSVHICEQSEQSRGQWNEESHWRGAGYAVMPEQREEIHLRDRDNYCNNAKQSTDGQFKTEQGSRSRSINASASSGSIRLLRVGRYLNR